MVKLKIIDFLCEISSSSYLMLRSYKIGKNISI